jgi:outer membrane lipoprotein-sorting protein
VTAQPAAPAQPGETGQTNAPAPATSPAPAPPQTGRQVLDRSEAAYAALSSVTADVTATINGVGTTVHVSYARPAGLRIDGTSIASSRWSAHTIGLVFDGTTTWVQLFDAWSVQQPMPGVSNVELGLAGMNGLTSGAASPLPALLLNRPLNYPYPSTPTLPHPVLDKVDGHPAYRVDSPRPQMVTSFWIDATTFLLVKRTITLSQGYNSVVTIHYSSVNEPVDPKLFEPPAIAPSPAPASPESPESA